MHDFFMKPKYDEEVDHKNGHGYDNQSHNMRNCTHAENMYNRRKHKFHNGKKTSSIYRGVSWHKQANKWVAQSRVKGKKTHLGLFTSEIEAAKAYNLAAIKYFGEFANLNQIDKETANGY